MTSVSVVVAVFIGPVEVLGLLSEKLGLEDGVWSIIRNLNAHMDDLGYIIVAIFVASWIGSALVYRFGRYDNLALEQPPS